MSKFNWPGKTLTVRSQWSFTIAAAEAIGWLGTVVCASVPTHRSRPEKPMFAHPSRTYIFAPPYACAKNKGLYFLGKSASRTPLEVNLDRSFTLSVRRIAAEDMLRLSQCQQRILGMSDGRRRFCKIRRLASRAELQHGRALSIS